MRSLFEFEIFDIRFGISVLKDITIGGAAIALPQSGDHSPAYWTINSLQWSRVACLEGLAPLRFIMINYGVFEYSVGLRTADARRQIFCGLVEWHDIYDLTRYCFGWKNERSVLATHFWIELLTFSSIEENSEWATEMQCTPPFAVARVKTVLGQASLYLLAFETDNVASSSYTHISGGRSACEINGREMTLVTEAPLSPKSPPHAYQDRFLWTARHGSERSIVSNRWPFWQYVK